MTFHIGDIVIINSPHRMWNNKIGTIIDVTPYGTERKLIHISLIDQPELIGGFFEKDLSIYNEYKTKSSIERKIDQMWKRQQWRNRNHV
jgi:hypothetical protein